MKNVSTYTVTLGIFLTILGIPALAIGTSISLDDAIQDSAKAVVAEELDIPASTVGSVDIAEEKAKAKKDEESKEEKAEEAKQDEAGGLTQDARDSNTSTGANDNYTSNGGNAASAPVHGNSAAASQNKAKRWVVDTPAWDEQVWVSNPTEVWVIDSPAWDEVVPAYDVLIASDGSEFYDYDSYAQYNREHNGSLSVSVRSFPEHTIHHDEVGHWETVDNGYYQTVHHAEVGHWE